jgi:hypothetical protein
MAKFYSSILDLGNLGHRKVAVCNVNPEDLQQSNNVSVDKMHHIQVLDRSGSMYRDIDDLIENVKDTIRFIPDGDYVSIIWFSGADECKVLIKGAQKNDSLFALLDTLKSVLGVTCFSAPMVEVGNIINDLKPICPNFSVTVFTDGQPVVAWGTEEEIRRTLEAIDTWKDDVLALNTIGYGNYYDQDFLKQMSSKTIFGQFIHSADINEYKDIFSHNYEITSDLIMTSVEVVAPGSEVMYLTSKLAVKGDANLKTRAIDKRKNQFVVVGQDENDFSFLFGEDSVGTSNMKEIPTASITPIMYAYAYTSYYEGNRKQAMDIMAKVLHDKHGVDVMRNAFTYDETAAVTKFLRQAMLSTKYRMIDGECASDYVASDNAPCLMDVLGIILKGEDSQYKYTSDYSRIGKKVEDTFNLFHRDTSKEVLTPVSELVFNKSRLNISIKSVIEGTVSLNPKQAAKVGLPNELPSKIYRNQTLIKDGAPNMSEVQFLVNADTYAELKALNLDNAIIGKMSDAANQTYTVVIKLHELPIINYSYVGDCTDVDNLLKVVVRQNYLQAAQKVLGFIRDEVYDYRKAHGIFDTSKQFAQYTPEQIEVLKEHGLNDRAEYVGVNNVAQKSGDSYVTRELEFQLKGYSTLPTKEKFYDKISKSGKLNGPETMMSTAKSDFEQLTAGIDYGSNEYLAKVNASLLKVKSQLAAIRMVLASQKIALVLTGEWFTGLEVDKKGNYLYSDGENTLVIKANRTVIEL